MWTGRFGRVAAGFIVLSVLSAFRVIALMRYRDQQVRVATALVRGSI